MTDLAAPGDLVPAMVLERPRDLRVRSLPRPSITDDDALLRVEACGLCGTDHEQFTAVFGEAPPFVPGHESVGIIEEIGERAAERWEVAAGDRVAVEVFQSCRECAACRAGTYNRCERHGLRDMYGFIGVDRAPGLWGGYARCQYLAPDSMVLPVPPGLDPVTATLFNPLGAGIRWAVTVPGTEPGDVVVVLGPGIRGLSAVAAAKDAGASFVAVAGVGPRDTERLALATRFGADLTVDVATRPAAITALRAPLRAVGIDAVDLVVDVTAKAPTALASAMQLVRPGGTIVCAGISGAALAEFDHDLIIYKELRILGALGVDVTAYRAALDLLASGRYPFEAVPRAVVGFDGISDLLATMAGETDRPPPVHGVFVPTTDHTGALRTPAPTS